MKLQRDGKRSLKGFPFLLIFCVLFPALFPSQSLLPPQGIEEYPNPFKHLSEAVLKARALKFHVDLLMLDHNGERDQYGNYLGGGFVGAWIEYYELMGQWSKLTMEQEPGTISVELVQNKALLIEAADRLLEEWDLVQSDLKNIKKKTKELPPK